MNRIIDEKPITVARLIELLRECPQDAIVDSEGCDCTQAAYGVWVYDPGDGPKRVAICRERAP